MIILGTYDFGSKEKTALIYENLIEQMKYDYQNDYILLFKNVCCLIVPRVWYSWFMAHL